MVWTAWVCAHFGCDHKSHSRFAHFGSGFQELPLDGSNSLSSAHRILCEGTILLHTGTMTEFAPSEQGQNCMVDCRIIGHTA